MTYINNQYIRLDIPLEEIAKIEVRTDEKNRMISDIDIIIKKEKKFLGFKYGSEISLESPNIIIAYGIYNKIDYCNIYGSVKILITDYFTLMGKIEEIPEFIEVIIVRNIIYYDRNKKNSDKDFDLLIFENNEDKFEMKVERLIERGKINSYNNIESTILNYLIWNKKEEMAIKVIDKMEIETINKANKYRNTALILACSKQMERVALKLLERENININYVDQYGETAMVLATSNNMKSVIEKIKELQNK